MDQPCPRLPVNAELAGPLLARRNDAELKAICNRHSGSDYDADQAADNAEVKSMLEDILGIELGDDVDIGSPEDVLRSAEAQMKEQQTRDEAGCEVWAGRRARRKKSAKQLAGHRRNPARDSRSEEGSACIRAPAIVEGLAQGHAAPTANRRFRRLPLLKRGEGKHRATQALRLKTAFDTEDTEHFTETTESQSKTTTQSRGDRMFSSVPLC